MIALGIVVAVLLLICFTRVGIIAVYSEDGLTADATIGFFRLRLMPQQKKKDRKKPPKKKAESTAKAGKLVGLKDSLPSINQALSRLKRKLLIVELTIHYMAAGEDPAAAALYFGGVSAGYGLILPLLENNFRIKKRDLRTAVNFDVSEPYIYVRAKISLAVWEAVYIGFGVVKNLVISGNMRAKIRKAV